jgi:hypothetical protein
MEAWEHRQVDKTADVPILAAPGTYALLLHLENPTPLQIGAMMLPSMPHVICW